MAWDLKQCIPDITVYSDASGGWGCGAFADELWFQLEWPPQVKDVSIAIKELIPVVVSAALFEKAWSGHLVEFKVDNIAVVHILQSTYCKEPYLMHLVRLLIFFAAYYNFWFSASHIAGELNTGADALSRNNLSLFFSQAPKAAQNPAFSLHPSSAHITTDSEHHMDVHSLDGAVQHYLTSALAQSSHNTYQAAANKYLGFCESFNLSSLPTSEATLCHFSACLAQQGLAYSTIRTYLSGIRQLQIAQGLPEPKTDSMPRLHQVLRGIQLDHSKHGKPTNSRLPITPAILKQLKAIWIKDRDKIPLNNIMLWAACLTTFFSFCRSGEITVERENLHDPSCHLSYSDLAVDNPSNPSIFSMLIKKSKTDQGRKGAKVYLGRTGDSLRPIAALEAYLSVRGFNPYFGGNPEWLYQSQALLNM